MDTNLLLPATMPRAPKHLREAAARAREGRARQRLGLNVPVSSPVPTVIEIEDSDDEVCHWDGSVNCYSEAESDDAAWLEEEDLQSDTETDTVCSSKTVHTVYH